MSSSISSGPPYAPQIAGVGGRSTVIPDVPILCILILFYAGSAAGNMSILQLNLRKGHKFLVSGALFGFSMARILTCSLRIGSAYHPANISLSIAAGIFVNAGILIAYIVNILFAQRILRSRQPEIGWHPLFRVCFRIIYALIGLVLVLVIVFTILTFYTLDNHLRTVSRDIQLAAITFLLVVAALPLLMLAVTFALPSPASIQFGTGSTTAKALILATSATLCTLGAGFKAGAQWQHPRPLSNPAWYQSKACFYVFYFVIEILILYMFIITRVDRRFHVPNGSSKRRTLAAELEEKDPMDETTTDRDTDTEKPVEARLGSQRDAFCLTCN